MVIVYSVRSITQGHNDYNTKCEVEESFYTYLDITSSSVYHILKAITPAIDFYPRDVTTVLAVAKILSLE